MTKPITHFIFFNFIFIYFSFSYSNHLELFNSINYITTANNFLNFQTNFKTVIIDSRNKKFKKMVYLLNKKSNVIEIDIKNQLIWNNKLPIKTKAEMEKSLTGNQVSGFPNSLIDEAVNLLEHRFGVHMNIINNLKTYELLDSKTNTCKAMLKLKEKYADDTKMKHYLNLFFPDTGFIHSIEDIEDLLQTKKHTGLVIKLDRGILSANVLILPPSKLQQFTSARQVVMAIANRFHSLQSSEEVLQAMSNTEFIWQEYIDIQNNEMRALYYVTPNNQLEFEGYSSNLTENGYWKSFHFEPQAHKETFDAIDNDALAYFNRIVQELMDTKINLYREYSKGLYDEDINLKIFCVDILPKSDFNKVIPVISEINPNLTGHNFAYHSFLKRQSQETTDKNHFYTWLLSYPINTPQLLSAEDIVSEIKTVYSEHFDIRKDPFDLGGFIFDINETYLVLGLIFPTLAKDAAKEYIERMDKFSISLQSRLKEKSLKLTI